MVLTPRRTGCSPTFSRELILITGTQHFNMGANKMGMIANMILNFPVDPMVTLVIIIYWL